MWTAKLARVNRFTLTRSCYLTSLCVTGLVGFCLVNAVTTCSVKVWNCRLLAWQNEFNKVLEPLGIFCKSRSEHLIEGQESFIAPRIARWIAFALSPEEIESLKVEPHLSGICETGCVLCCEDDESHYCMHP